MCLEFAEFEGGDAEAKCGMEEGGRKQRYSGPRGEAPGRQEVRTVWWKPGAGAVAAGRSRMLLRARGRRLTFAVEAGRVVVVRGSNASEHGLLLIQSGWPGEARRGKARRSRRRRHG